MLAAIVDVAGVGLPVMGLLIALESTGIPLPGETALITAALLASQDKLSIAAVIPVAAGCAVLGDNCGYLLGRKGGRRLLQHRIFRGHGERLIERGQPFFERHGGKTVFLGRWFAGLRIAAAWLAGINHMPWPRFLMWNALGGAAWATSVGLLAYFLGTAAEHALKTVGIAGAATTVGVFVLAYVFVRVRRRRSERRSEPAGAGSREGGAEPAPRRRPA